MSHRSAQRHFHAHDDWRDVVVPALPSRRSKSYFDILVLSIISQQISGAAATAIYRRLRSHAGARLTPQKILTMRTATLRRLGISPQKAGYLRDLARRFAVKDINPQRFARMPDEAVIADLTRVKGIGTWTAHMLLIFSMGREDVFPAGDLGIQKAFAKRFGERTVKDMAAFAERWKPYRTYAALMLWRSIDTAAADAWE